MFRNYSKKDFKSVEHNCQEATGTVFLAKCHYFRFFLKCLLV